MSQPLSFSISDRSNVTGNSRQKVDVKVFKNDKQHSHFAFGFLLRQSLNWLKTKNKANCGLESQ